MSPGRCCTWMVVRTRDGGEPYGPAARNRGVSVTAFRRSEGGNRHRLLEASGLESQVSQHRESQGWRDASRHSR